MLQDALGNIWKIGDIRRRLIFTAVMLAVFRLGSHLPVPGVSPEGLARFWGGQGGGGIFGMIDMFSGGAFQKFSLFALGIMPYINASIILQLLTVVFPDSLGKLAKEGEAGRQKITQYTRYGTVVLAFIQGAGLTYYMATAGAEYGVVPNPNATFYFITVLTLTTGTAFLMWVGEQITENGLGNGISILISCGIIARAPAAVQHTVRLLREGELSVPGMVFLGVVMLAATAATVVMTLGVRKVPIQYARQIRGRKVYGGMSQFLPLRVNAAGVIPVIFAQALLQLPQMAGGVIGAANDPESIVGKIFAILMPGTWFYNSLYVVGLIFFTFFYTAIIINPEELADNLRKHGGSIPGVRPGRPTAAHLEWIIMRITMAGAIFLCLICLLPQILIRQFGVPFYFGGTALLIVVGVQLDTIKQLEAQLLQRHYDGFVKSRR
ncbi:MAG: preprotein translocase subunit SecY [Candidatus Hydrogenedentota bacterium]|nr:MAG: preprotein translocase subunit SecY [Candidatus Hydrogenedentota bacterium]